ncbi:MAG: phosphatase PAP2 family protein [Treponema sp.]|nr:phosphatase PAP2 family protein [Treponema sp.]
MTLDGSILIWIQENLRNSFLSSFIVPYSLSGNYAIPWFIVVIVLLIFKKTRKIGVLALISMAVAFCINDFILKNLIARPRPFLEIPELMTLVKRPSSYSCPSGHTAIAFGFAVSILMNAKKRYGFIALFFALLMGFSRMYVGVHYPSDVLLGLLLGSTVAILVSVFGNRILRRKHIREDKGSVNESEA